ncbi:hypothetical protein FHL15_007451 [Xylaria flabelliformis]|uniref:Uncharacterized protein n=1 Tax=Xylaria flabelliformis TaxID=2512241 RepID=A0A553HUP2_9PEZI|nr:hypothetical protein FHL15_007451 [Xylaria flabelliformis]
MPIYQLENSVSILILDFKAVRVYNHGSVSIEPHGYNSRVVEIDVSFSAAFGELESESDEDRSKKTAEEANEARRMLERMLVS